MARGGLSARAVETAKPGKHEDGQGLRLVVDRTGAKRWVLRITVAGARREMGLGAYPTVSLADARGAADAARKLAKGGADPVAARRAERAAAAASSTGSTFGEFAAALVADIEHGFRNEKHRQQWRNTLATYCAPIWTKPLADITTDGVLECLKPIWTTKAETASRVRGRIERVLDAARAKGLRSGENPARWRGHLANLLPKRHKLTRGHHAAMAFADVPAFLAELRAVDGVSARALEFAILTAARSGEVLGARWAEIDLGAKVWTVPAARMKAGREHRVPLSPRAVAIIEAMAGARVSDFIFPGARRGKPLSVMAMAMLLRDHAPGVTVHGFRSAFRDWCGEATAFPREIAEAALAHTVGDATERAYRRGDALDKRRALMEAWGAFCEPHTGNVVPMIRPPVAQAAIQ